jgi:uncharacterized repeat protein (TIGR03803 family)
MQKHGYFLTLTTMLAVFTAMVFADTAWAATESVVHAFPSFTEAGGQFPRAGLILDAAGNLYGTTSSGGAHNGGSVFELTPSAGGWTGTLLYSFCAQTACTDGMEPFGGLTFDASGNLYGTTRSGGANAGGTVFELTHAANGWSESVLYSFCARTLCEDGTDPQTSVILDSAGNLYGTTAEGGRPHSGTVFKLTPTGNGSWVWKLLYAFAGGADGKGPTSLILGTSGDLYGTAVAAGEGDDGTVFELSPTANGSWVPSTLHYFQGGTDGKFPSGLVFDTAGNLYGTTTGGGGTSGRECGICFGTVFELTPNSAVGWTESVLYRFTRGSDGSTPSAGVILDQAGNLYGTTLDGGTGMCRDNTGCGTVFELSPDGDGDWSESVLYSFTGGTNGDGPLSGLVFDSFGNLYGTTSSRTFENTGIVFEITP